MSTRQISVRDFAAHCDEELTSVEKGSTVVELVRDGKVIAFLYPAIQPKKNTGTLSDWMGVGAGYSLAPGCSLEDPAFVPDEWEEASGQEDS